MAVGLLSLGTLPALTSADVSRRLGTGSAGSGHREGIGFQRWEAAELAGVSIVRYQHHTIRHVFPQGYGGPATCPQPLEDQVKVTQERGMDDQILIEYGTKSDGDPPDYSVWKAAGRALAERYRPGSVWNREQGHRDWGINYYTVMNEPSVRRNDPRILTAARHRAEIGGFADTVQYPDSRRYRQGGATGHGRRRLQYRQDGVHRRRLTFS